MMDDPRVEDVIRLMTDLSDIEIAEELQMPLSDVENIINEYIDDRWEEHLDYLADHPFCFPGDY